LYNESEVLIRRVELAAFHCNVQQSPLYDFDGNIMVDGYR